MHRRCSSLARNRICEANWDPVVCPFFSLVFFFFSRTYVSEALAFGLPGQRDRRPRNATGEEQRALLSDADGERTLSDFREPRELNVVVAESSVRRRTGIPKKVSVERAGLQLRAIRLLKDEDTAGARRFQPPTP